MTTVVPKTSTILQYKNKPNIYLYLLIFSSLILQGSYFRMALALLLTALAIPLLRQWKHIQLDPMSSLLAGLPVLAILSLILFSIDVNSALTEYCRYLILFIAYLYMKLQDHKQTQTIFYNAFIALGAFGLLAKLGVSVIPSMIIAENGRMQSFLQYANTTALFMSIGLFQSLKYYQTTHKMSHFVLCLFFVICLLATGSRFTFVLTAVALVVYVLTQLPLKYKLLGSAFACISLLIIALSGSRVLQLSLTEPTLIERVITYQDAFKVLLENPFGIGLGNWQFMQFEFQSAPYQVRYVHNALLNLGLDLGVLGLMVVMILLYRVWKSKGHAYEKSLLLFVCLQSQFEVSLQFGFTLIYIGSLLAALEFEPLPVLKLKPQLEQFFDWLKPLIAVTALATSFFLLMPEDSTYTQALTATDPEETLGLLETLIEKQPYHFQARISLIQGYTFMGYPLEALNMAEQLNQQFPYSSFNQSLYWNALENCLKTKAISLQEYDQATINFKTQIETLKQQLNPLYQYIQVDLSY